MNPLDILTLAPPHVASETVAALREIERRRSAGEITDAQAAEKLGRLLETTIEARKTADDIDRHNPSRWVAHSRVALAQRSPTCVVIRLVRTFYFKHDCTTFDKPAR